MATPDGKKPKEEEEEEERGNIRIVKKPTCLSVDFNTIKLV